MTVRESKPRAAAKRAATTARKPLRKPARQAASPVPQPSLTALGLRVRHARTMLGATLRTVAEQVGCSESMLSKIECGQAAPSLSTLHRIAQVLQTNVAELTTVSEATASPVMRAGARPVVRFDGPGASDGISLERIVPPQRGQLLQGDIHVLEPGADAGEAIRHQGEEFGYVLEGTLELTIDGHTWRLKEGDCFYFGSDQPHRYRNPGRVRTRVLWVNTPPTF